MATNVSAPGPADSAAAKNRAAELEYCLCTCSDRASVDMTSVSLQAYEETFVKKNSDVSPQSAVRLFLQTALGSLSRQKDLPRWLRDVFGGDEPWTLEHAPYDMVFRPEYTQNINKHVDTINRLLVEDPNTSLFDALEYILRTCSPKTSA